MKRPVLLVSAALAASMVLVPTAGGASGDSAVTGAAGASVRPAAEVGRARLGGVDAAASDDVWAVGFSTSHGHSYPLTEHWDGVRWSVVPNPGAAGEQLASVGVISSDDVWAVGGSRRRTLAMHWDGTAWTVARTPSPKLNPFLEDVAAVGPDDVWAVGRRRVDEEVGTLTLVEHWDGSHWSVVRSPNPHPTGENSLESVTVIGPSDVLAVGSSEHSPLAERWNGTTWQVERTAPAGPESQFSAVDAIAGNDIWAVGGGFRGSYFSALTQHWDGTAWSNIAPRTPRKASTDLIGVDGSTTDDVWAVGSDHPVSGKNHTLAIHWDGTAWSRSATPSPARFGGSDLGSVVTIAPDDAWAVGLYAVGRFAFKPLIEHWDGATWTKVRAG